MHTKIVFAMRIKYLAMAICVMRHTPDCHICTSHSVHSFSVILFFLLIRENSANSLVNIHRATSIISQANTSTTTCMEIASALLIVWTDSGSADERTRDDEKNGYGIHDTHAQRCVHSFRASQWDHLTYDSRQVQCPMTLMHNWHLRLIVFLDREKLLPISLFDMTKLFIYNCQSHCGVNFCTILFMLHDLITVPWHTTTIFEIDLYIFYEM